MAIVPSNTRFVGISSSVDLKEKKSAAINKETQPYTIEDIAETIGGGGGGLGDFVVEANGTMGNGVNVGYSFSVDTKNIQAGINVFPVRTLISASMYGSGGYNSSFTATEAAFPGLEYGSSITFNGTPLLVLDFPDLIAVSGSMAYFSMNQNQLLTTISAPSLISADNMNMSNNPALVNLDFASLKDVAYNFDIQSTSITGLTSAQLPVLENVGNIITSSVSVIDLPSVKTLESVSLYGNSVTTIKFPALVQYKGYSISITQKPNLTDFVLGTIGTFKRVTTSTDTTIYSFSVDLSLCSLNEASVNGIATLLASLDGTNGTCNAISGALYLNGGLNAAPTGAGATAIQTLLSRGWMVATN